MRYTDFHISISAEEVCRLLDGQKSTLGGELAEELEEMLPEAFERLEPQAFLGVGDTEDVLYEEEAEEGQEALYVITTVGEALSGWSGELFREGDCVKAMLADAIADHCLFQMDRQLREPVLGLCRQQGLGIRRRLEAPQDAPMEIQKKALQVSGAGEGGMEITEGLMYRPVKSACQVFLLTRDRNQFFWEHDCSGCPDTSCRMRKGRPPVLEVETVDRDGLKRRRIRGHVQAGQSILETLRAWGIYLDAPCGGRGTCGKCRIRLVKGDLAVTEADRSHFSEEELKNGMRLACRAHPAGDCVIRLKEARENAFYIPGSPEKAGEESLERKSAGKAGRNGVAVDIGTTTVAMELADLETGERPRIYTSLNTQRQYGADVISRIQAADEGKAKEMQTCIRDVLREGLARLTDGGKEHIDRMVIGANTTMVHLLMGYPCHSLGVYPFTPHSTERIDTGGQALLGEAAEDFDVSVFPGVSAYIGGDITAGLYALDFHRKEEVSVLVDLGTNGEMAVGNKERILAASAAAGPAFEGGNIICGTGSIPGAICSARWNGQQMELQTIGGGAPVGICGTGIIEAVYEMMEAGILDETGRLEEPWDEEGFPLDGEGKIRIFQKDIREIQLAKAAVRAGLETLLAAYGVEARDVDTFYIAGGFGCQLDIEKAAGIGLLPQDCVGKARPAGNTSLEGALRYLREADGGAAVDEIAGKVREISLSTDRNFQQLYMEYMYFGEDEE